jgi:UDPglucose 6-dehydrogenase
VTTTNALNAISNAVGANWDDIRQALQLDRRIGTYAYLQPGLGISGGNIERDLQTLNDLVQLYGLDESLFETFLNNSSRQKNWIFEAITAEILAQNPKAKIGILGLAYKENTNSTKNSMALEVIHKFGNQISGFYDPIADLPEGMETVKAFSTAYDCIANSDAIVVMTPWKEFSDLDFVQIQAARMEGFVIIDPYAILNRTLLPMGVLVKGLF